MALGSLHRHLLGLLLSSKKHYKVQRVTNYFPVKMHNYSLKVLWFILYTTSTEISGDYDTYVVEVVNHCAYKIQVHQDRSTRFIKYSFTDQ